MNRLPLPSVVPCYALLIYLIAFHMQVDLLQATGKKSCTSTIHAVRR